MTPSGFSGHLGRVGFLGYLGHLGYLPCPNMKNTMKKEDDPSTKKIPGGSSSCGLYSQWFSGRCQDAHFALTRVKTYKMGASEIYNS